MESINESMRAPVAEMYLDGPPLRVAVARAMGTPPPAGGIYPLDEMMQRFKLIVTPTRTGWCAWPTGEVHDKRHEGYGDTPTLAAARAIAACGRERFRATD